MTEYGEFYYFILMYHLLLRNLAKRNQYYKIFIYFLDNEFNINIKNLKNDEIVFNDHFKITLEEYNDLISILGFNFIENHTINLPFFENISLEDAKIYYSSNESNNKPLDYDKAKIHVLRNSNFELKIYYFNGLEKSSYEMQDKALKKLKMNC